jgi:hypothetical protein
VHAIYRSEQRSIPILARTKAHSFTHVLIQSPHQRPLAKTQLRQEQTRESVFRIKTRRTILYLILRRRAYSNSSLSRFWLITTHVCMCLFVLARLMLKFPRRSARFTARLSPQTHVLGHQACRTHPCVCLTALLSVVGRSHKLHALPSSRPES